MKRGDSGLSLLVGVNKPVGMSSHDVVNRCRKVFGERRCGHTGTLDPLASGVLPICVGPATRLDQYMTAHDKSYRVDIAFGFETATDDAAGEQTIAGEVPAVLRDEAFARTCVAGLVGSHLQVPPLYSAIKVDGKRAYQSARKGSDVVLKPREVTVYDASLVDLFDDPDRATFVWRVDVSVSKGTYIRSLARDLGRDLKCPAHVSALERRSAGRLSLAECVSLETLSQLGTSAAIDPVRVLGYRYAFADDFEKFVSSGTYLRPDQVLLNEALPANEEQGPCACMSGVCRSLDGPVDGELACIVVGNRLKAIYRYSDANAQWRADCVFSTPIARRY